MKVPIITYHAIGDVPSPLWTTIETFEAHLAAFARSGYRTIALADLLTLLHQGESLPAKTIVITFDDGYESVYQHARALLKHYGFTATVFLITDRCGLTNQWDGQPSSVPVEALLSWVQVAELAAEGYEFGAHTRSHLSLPTVLPEVAAAEMSISQQQIQTQIGQDVRVFAYPYGATNSAITKLTQQYFDGAVGTDLGFVDPQTDPYLLNRIDAYYLSPASISLMHSSLFQQYLNLRQMLRTLRRSFHPDWLATSAQNRTEGVDRSR
jgi:peptidoglycan/xylan/chitin deacetylase (PgdA/CDA1 family)